MDKKKLIILAIIVIAVLMVMMFAAGAYRSKTDSKPAKPQENPLAVLIEKVTGWMRADFDRGRLRGCSRSGSRIGVSGSCVLTILPTGSGRPSDFTLQPNGLVAMCFAFTMDELNKCITKQDMQVPRDPPAKFTVAKDSAFIFLQCKGTENTCAVTIGD